MDFAIICSASILAGTILHRLIRSSSRRHASLNHTATAATHRKLSAPHVSSTSNSRDAFSNRPSDKQAYLVYNWHSQCCSCCKAAQSNKSQQDARRPTFERTRPNPRVHVPALHISMCQPCTAPHHNKNTRQLDKTQLIPSRVSLSAVWSHHHLCRTSLHRVEYTTPNPTALNRSLL
jgi:hypothetical protein